MTAPALTLLPGGKSDIARPWPPMLRIQLSRAKGWKMPAGTVKCDRTSEWGNPYRVGEPCDRRAIGRWGWKFSNPDQVCDAVEEAVRRFGAVLALDEAIHPYLLSKLWPSNLACWCGLCDAHREGKPLGVTCPDCDPCHVDALGRTVVALHLEGVCQYVAGAQVDLSTEAAAQADMERLLVQGFARDGVRREVRLSPTDRIDFLVVGGVGIEMKIGGGRRAAFAGQLERYARHDAVSALILATNTATADVPSEINGKPVRVVSLGRGWL